MPIWGSDFKVLEERKDGDCIVRLIDTNDGLPRWYCGCGHVGRPRYVPSGNSVACRLNLPRSDPENPAPDVQS